MRAPLLEQRFEVPDNRQIDVPLLAGSALFGAGWGLAGLCPGPAIAGLVLGRWELWLFAGAMFAGMLAAGALTARPGRSGQAARR